MKITTRKEWGAKPPKKGFSKLGEVKGLVVHWSAYPTAISKEEELSQLTQIQALHQNDRKWNDIAYNFCVGDSGTLYEARGFGNRSAAQGGKTRDEINYNNKHYIAVCWLGGSNADDQPSKEAVSAVKELWKKVGGQLRPHSSFKSTSCPGDMWRKWIDNRLTFVPKEVKAAEVVKETTRFSIIKKGDSGESVEQLQIMLNFVNKIAIPIDGDFGNKTLASVVIFQRKYKLTPDGIVGQLTYAKLIEANRSTKKRKEYKID
tara:strand:+ start:158 stop:940 length:783 start_codon:yes stop_codon:yes gene_type:complete